MKKNKKIRFITMVMTLCAVFMGMLTPITAKAAVRSYATSASMSGKTLSMNIILPTGKKTTLSTSINSYYGKGQVGNPVIMIQAALNAAMDTNIAVDGQFGTATRNALVAFQQTHMGYAQADGICGPKTWDILYIRVLVSMLFKNPK